MIFNSHRNFLFLFLFLYHLLFLFLFLFLHLLYHLLPPPPPPPPIGAAARVAGERAQLVVDKPEHVVLGDRLREWCDGGGRRKEVSGDCD
jgi:hypothetical protein